MSRTLRSLFLVALLLGALSPSTSAQSEYDFSAVDRLLEDNAGRMGGGCSLVIVRNGQVVYRKSFGTFTDETVVPIASATKWLSGATIMALVDEGAISLDDPASRYLPTFTGEKGTITIRQLFSHTSGLPSNTLCAFNRETTLQQCVDSIGRNSPLQAAPGAEFAYGNSSMHAAGRIAEIVKGASWDAVFQEKIAGPLDLRHTDYEGLGETGNPLIAGGARSSLDDYARFLQMLLDRGVYNGRRVLSEASVEEMLRDQTNGAVIVSTPYEAYAYLDPRLPENRYGIGNWIESASENSSQGAFGASPWIDRRRNLAGFLLVYDELGDVMPVYLELKQLVREIIPPTTADERAPVVAEVAVSKKKIKRKKDPTATITWQSSDDVAVVSHDVLLALDGESFTVEMALNLPGSAASFTWAAAQDLPKTKIARVKIIARDAAGNVGEAVSGEIAIK